MVTDGKVHDLSFFEGESEYIKINVTKDNYDKLAAEGLYEYSGDYKVPAGAKRIIFKYRKPDGTLIEQDTVPVMYDGPEGPKGEKGSSYKGSANSWSDITDWVKNDTYLNLTDGYIYRYDYPEIAGESAFSRLSYEDFPTEYFAALNDGIAAISGQTETVPFMKAVNAWMKNLVAQTAIINEVFSNVITVQNQIKSANWGSGNTGFMLDANGQFECVNGKFNGAIDSGPLYLNFGSPGDISFIYAENHTIYELYLELMSKGVYTGNHICSGTFNGENIDSISISSDSKSHTSTTDNYGNFYPGDKTENFWKDVSAEYYSKYWSNYNNIESWIPFVGTRTIFSVNFNFNDKTIQGLRIVSKGRAGVNVRIGNGYGGYTTRRLTQEIDDTYYIGTTSGDTSVIFNISSNTLLLRDLPTGLASNFPPGTIWNNNGYLCIKS